MYNPAGVFAGCGVVDGFGTQPVAAATAMRREAMRIVRRSWKDVLISEKEFYELLLRADNGPEYSGPL